MSENVFRSLSRLLPEPPVLAGRVIAHHDDDTSTVELPINLALTPVGGSVARGALIRPRGRTVPIGGWAFVRRGVIETRAPDNVPQPISVGVPPVGGGVSSTWHLPINASQQLGPGMDQPTVSAGGRTLNLPPNTGANPFVTIYAGPGASTGKRLFEIVADAITFNSGMGFIVDRSESELEIGMYGYKETDRWVLVYDGTSGECVTYTDFYNFDSTTYFTGNGWPLITDGTVLTFCLDLDLGRLDKLKINGADASLEVDDPAAWAIINAWPANQIVRPAFNGRPNGLEPHGTFTINSVGADILYPEAGYTPWGA